MHNWKEITFFFTGNKLSSYFAKLERQFQNLLSFHFAGGAIFNSLFLYPSFLQVILWIDFVVLVVNLLLELFLFMWFSLFLLLNITFLLLLFSFLLLFLLFTSYSRFFLLNFDCFCCYCFFVFIVVIVYRVLVHIWRNVRMSEDLAFFPFHWQCFQRPKKSRAVNNNHVQ